jgi:hypothetical protein
MKYIFALAALVVAATIFPSSGLLADDVCRPADALPGTTWSIPPAPAMVPSCATEAVVGACAPAAHQACAACSPAVCTPAGACAAASCGAEAGHRPVRNALLRIGKRIRHPLRRPE